MAVVLPAIGLDTPRLVAAEAVLLAAASYNSVVHVLVLRKHALLTGGY